VPPRRAGETRQRLTYAELDARAEALAHRLSTWVTGECVVAVLLPRAGPDLWIAQLAIMKAGAAWTCIEPDTPEERLRFLLEDSRAVAVVAEADRHDVLRATGFAESRIVSPQAVPGSNGVAHARTSPAWLGPETLAYVIYTSGTTGRPKGVMIEHRSVANLVQADAARFGITPADRCAQTSSAAYDSSVEELWLAWGVGATVVVVDDERVRSGPDFLPWLRDERITVWCPAPTMLRMTCSDDPRRDLPDVKLVYVGGEELTPDVSELWSPGRWLENGYGPTECTVTCVRTRMKPGVPVTIGWPLTGNRAWCLDADLRELPAGELGELYMGGIGLARGYLGRPDLTRERFFDHPKLGRIYRTGDLARKQPNGEFTYHGRADTQVKIRGHRLELTAVESELCRCEGIIEAACRVQANGAGPELVAFVVTTDGREPDRDALRVALRRQLPEAMVPAHIARMDALPRAPLSGKLDRRALPELAHDPAPAAAGRAPAGELERLVAAAFASHLPKAGSITAEADFFLELGGNSLVAAQVISTLRREPRTTSLTVRDLYEARTVAGLAAKVHAGTAPRTRARSASANEVANISPHAAWGVATQGAFIGAALLAVVNAVWFLASRLVPWLTHSIGVTASVLLLPSLMLVGALLWTLVAATLTVLAKRVLIGRYAAGRHPHLGSMYVRHWVVMQFARSIPWDLLESTGLRAWLLRALGARVGADVHLHRGVALHHVAGTCSRSATAPRWGATCRWGSPPTTGSSSCSRRSGSAPTLRSTRARAWALAAGWNPARSWARSRGSPRTPCSPPATVGRACPRAPWDVPRTWRPRASNRQVPAPGMRPCCSRPRRRWRKWRSSRRWRWPRWCSRRGTPASRDGRRSRSRRCRWESWRW
jgi:amino acid adenylation domain-containing protein